MKHKLQISSEHVNIDAIDFCEKFLNSNLPKFVMGTNYIASQISASIKIDGFINDFSAERIFSDLPIYRLEEIPENALVVSSAIGKPFLIKKTLDNKNIRSLDYFAFQKNFKNKILPVKFWEQFREDFNENFNQYEWVFNLFEDQKSRDIFQKIINFRLTQNLDLMSGFTDTQDRQYFEDFLNLKQAGESFIDVGSFDGFTSLDFIKRCPQYSSVHIFEPEPSNLELIKSKLSANKNIYYHDFGLSDKEEVVNFISNGSSSRISTEGDLQVKLKKLDDQFSKPFTFLKMDIEGGELKALQGAKKLIAQFKPRLAISVYHRFSDFWVIPKEILSLSVDYKIYLRHYTEGVDETVMFFVPR